MVMIGSAQGCFYGVASMLMDRESGRHMFILGIMPTLSESVMAL